jgi:hypothetical protein
LSSLDTFLFFAMTRYCNFDLNRATVSKIKLSRYLPVLLLYFFCTSGP